MVKTKSLKGVANAYVTVERAENCLSKHQMESEQDGINVFLLP